MIHDSRPDTFEHIASVRAKLNDAAVNLLRRGEAHDRSKLEPPEREVFDEVTPRLKAMTYGSAEYKSCLAAMGPALAHHYAENSHHPEHYPSGIAGMSLLDLIEMLCDWKAATERHDDGDIRRSVALNAERFGISEQLARVLENTVEELSWR